MINEFLNNFVKYISSINLYKNTKTYIIINNTAGCFTKKDIFKTYFDILKELATGLDTISENISYIEGSKNSIIEFMSKKMDEHNKEQDKEYNKVIFFSLGGDGTHQFVFQQIMNNLKNQDVTLIRVPFGTGNDGALTHSFSSFLIKIKDYEPTYKNIVRLDLQNSSYYSHNVVSIGFDAMVVYLANRTKTYIPGNYYKFYTYITPFLYDIFYNKVSHIKLYLEDDTTTEIDTVLGLMAIGGTGHRVYGGGMPVLPDDNNVCIIDNPKTVIDKLVFKDSFVVGDHLKFKSTHMFSAKKIEYSVKSDMACQIDGEEIIIKNEVATFTKILSQVKL